MYKSKMEVITRLNFILISPKGFKDLDIDRHYHHPTKHNTNLHSQLNTSKFELPHLQQDYAGVLSMTHQVFVAE